MSDKKHIVISEKTKKILDMFVENKSETYEDIIKKLAREYIKINLDNSLLEDLK